MQLVVVVEDEYGNAEMLQAILETEGFRVACAANGKEGLALLDGEKPAVILSDFMMPHCTGAELGISVRSNPNLRDIPFVIITATHESVVRERFADYDAYVNKPYSADGLLRLVAHLALNGRPRRGARGEPPKTPAELAYEKLLEGLKF